MQLDVSGAKAGTPFWLVLGESLNSGWKATVDGHDAGAPSLVNGYANGWLVTPQHSTFSVTLDWTPQTQVWIGFAISVATLLVCLFLAIRGVRSRRRRQRGCRRDDGDLARRPRRRILARQPARGRRHPPEPARS